MPWTTADAETHKKGLTAKQARAWAHTANSALRACKRKGGSDCDVSAIRQANAVAGRVTESMNNLDVARMIVEALRIGDSHEAVRDALYHALGLYYRDTEIYAYIEHVFDTEFVAHVSGKCVKFSYKITDGGTAVISDPTDVELQYEVVGSESVEAADVDISGDVVSLLERAAKDGTAVMKLIQPGQGSSGYYPRKVLERDGPKVFKSGTKMFWDHPTPEEEADRPEGSLRNLAAELVEDARFESDHPEGPGLYAKAKLFGPYRDAVVELAPHIGVSIRASGKARDGQVGGKPTRIIEELTAARSVDFVTQAGAGGKVVQLFEAVRSRPTSEQGGSASMDEKEIQALREAASDRDRLKTENEGLKSQVDRLTETVCITEARSLITESLKDEEISELTRKRITESLMKHLPMKDGKLDRDALTVKVKETVAEEVAYLAGVGAGRIRGVGDGDGAGSGKDILAESQKEFAANISRLSGIQKKEE